MSEGPTLLQLRYFLRAVHTGSFSAAAEAEFVAQPSISEQIRRLERTLGAQLFTRTNRRLQLTDVGRMIIPLAEKTLQSAGELRTAAHDATALRGGAVSFGTFSSANVYMLTPLIAEFRALHPQVSLRVVGLNSSEVADQVRAGELEAGLVQLPIDDTNLKVSEPVLTDEVVFVSRDPQHTVKSASIENIAASSTLIISEAHWSETDPMRRGLNERAAQADVELKFDIEVESYAAALALAAAGLGDTVASFFSLKTHAEAKSLNWARLDPPYVDRFVFVTRASGGLSPSTARFMELARKHISQLPTLSHLDTAGLH